jgi:hypothetical protein
MNIRRAAFLAAVSLISLLDAAETGIEFAGVMTAGGKTRLALTDATNKSTTWVEPGQEFNGYTISRYDAKEEAIFVTKAGQETRIGMVAAKIPDAPAASTGDAASPQPIATAIRSNLQRLATAARQYQIQHGVNTVGYTDLVGPDKLIKELKPVAGENYSTLTFGQNVTGVSVTTANGSTISLELAPSAASKASSSGVATQVTQPPTVPAGAPTGREATAPTSVTVTTRITPPDSSETAGQQAAAQSYTLKGGETWETISTATGVPVPRLRELNPTLVEGAPLPAGQTIRIR